MEGIESKIQKALLWGTCYSKIKWRDCYSSPCSTRFFPWCTLSDNVCKARALEIFYGSQGRRLPVGSWLSQNKYTGPFVSWLKVWPVLGWDSAAPECSLFPPIFRQTCAPSFYFHTAHGCGECAVPAG